MVEHDGEILVDDPALRRIVLDLEIAVGEGQAVERLGGAGHGLGGRADETGDVGRSPALGSPARQRNRSCAGIVGDRKRERPVGGDPQPQVEPVEFETSHLHVEERERERVEANLAAWSRKNGSAGGVAQGEALETQAHAPGIMPDVGRPERQRVTVADPLSQ